MRVTVWWIRRDVRLADGLRLLDVDLQSRGSKLLVRFGRPEAVVPQVVSEVGGTAVPKLWMKSKPNRVT